MRNARLAALALAAILAAPARAEEAPRPLRYDLTVDGVTTGAAVAATLTLSLLGSKLAPTSCLWCDPGPFDRNVAKALVWQDRRAADLASSIIAEGVLPAGILAFGLLSASAAGDLGAWGVDTLLIAQAVSLSMVLNLSVKYLVGRERPYAFFGHDTGWVATQERNQSFYGGHTSFSFATATAAGTVFILRGYPGAGIVLGAGLGVAAFVGYLRMAAEMHYLSDVAVGAAAGALIGWAVPWIFHRQSDGGSPQPGSIFPAPGGIAIAF